MRRADTTPSAEKEAAKAAKSEGASKETGRSTAGKSTAGRRKQTATRPERRETSARLSARTPFQPPLSHDELEERVAGGMTVRRTRLTEAFTLSDYQERNPSAVLMFTHDGTTASVVTAESGLAQSGITLVALSPPTARGSQGNDPAVEDAPSQ